MNYHTSHEHILPSLEPFSVLPANIVLCLPAGPSEGPDERPSSSILNNTAIPTVRRPIPPFPFLYVHTRSCSIERFVGLAEVGLAEVGFTLVRLALVGLVLVGFALVGLAEVGLAEFGFALVGFALVGLAEVGSAL
jgi:hypothetical protein